MFSPLYPWWGAWQQADRHGAGNAAENSHLIDYCEAETETANWEGGGLLKP